MSILAFFGSPIAKLLGAGLAVSVIAGGAYMAIDHRGYARCERDSAIATAKDQEDAHQFYLAEVARGNALSAELVKTQRRLDETKAEYLAYANAITGNCPEPIRVLAHYAARNEPVPETARAPVDPASTVSAAAIAGNIAENFARCHANAAQLSALIEWHRHEGAVK